MALSRFAFSAALALALLHAMPATADSPSLSISGDCSGGPGRVNISVICATINGKTPVTTNGSGTQTLSGTYNITGTFEAGGFTMTFPGFAASLAALSGNQTFAGTMTFSNATHSALFTGGPVGIGDPSPGYAGQGTSTNSVLSVAGSVQGGPKSGRSATALGATSAFFETQGYWGLRAGTDNSFNLDLYNSASPKVAVTVLQNGNVGINNTAPASTLDVVGGVRAAVSIVSALPSCSSGNEGERRGVLDATATTFGSTVAGSGSNHVAVYCNGSNWLIGG